MTDNFKQIARNFMPPILLRALQKTIKRYGFFGDYPTWEDARNASSGYDSDLILNKVKESLLKIKGGEAMYERDSVIINGPQYSWPLLTGLLWIASQSGNKLNLIDFGGSLGSTYFQCRRFLTQLSELHWNIVEQDKFVKCGQSNFQDAYVKFYYDIDECLKKQSPNTILLSSVLPYIEKPYELIEKVVTAKIPYVIVDRTPFLEEGNDRITVQKVDPKIYEASYPAWFFNIKKFIGVMAQDYDLIAEFEALSGIIYLDHGVARDKGFIFRLKNNV